MSPRRLTFILVLCLAQFPALAQRQTAELRLRAVDPSGNPIPAQAELTSLSSQTRLSIKLPATGLYTFRNLPFGSYRLTVSQAGFQAASELIPLPSEIPVLRMVTLGVAPVETSVLVRDDQTLLNTQDAGSSYHIGAKTIEDRVSGNAGRGLIDLIANQPGWLLEANGSLHPRGSEYATQYVIDGFPIQDNRSPTFAPSFEADDVQEMQILTGGFPAEYGKKLGGVISLTTQRNAAPGFHGVTVLQGGSFSTAGAYVSGQYVASKTSVSASAEGFLTDRYLDPPVLSNFSNHGSNEGYTAAADHDFSAADHLRVSVSRHNTRFLVPNEVLQDQAGQRQDRTSLETAGQISYQHVFSANLLGSVRGMARDDGARLWSNPLATPISVAQARGFRDTYLGGSLAGHNGRHDWKTGTEENFTSIHEAFDYRIVAFELGGSPIFDADTPSALGIADRRQNREQSAFVQDQIRLGNLTVNAGLRYDHYRLLVDDQAWSPRLAVSYFIPKAKLVAHASYDRIFSTPAIENILVSASPATLALNNAAFYLPVRPSHANYYEAGLAKTFFDRLRLDANVYRRNIRNFGDDDLLLNTAVTFPIAFDRASIHGVEAKAEIPHWGPVSGFVSYSWMQGFGQLPIAGGLFLEDSSSALLASHDRFPVTQDQRHTARARLRYDFSSRLWTAASANYGSGLPVEFQGDESPDFLASQYGQAVVERVNFDKGRVRPSFSLDASIGVELWRKEAAVVRFQADLVNATNRVNVINFAGLFSGTAIAPPRSLGLRLRAEF